MAVRVNGILLLFLVSMGVNAQIAADFSVSKRKGCGTLQAEFVDLSTSQTTTIIAWEWDLGGVNSSLQNPGRIFNVPGVYDVCLTVTDSDGLTASKCKSQYIEVFALPDPDFSVDPVIGCAPLEAQFVDLSTSLDAPIVEWIWGVGGTANVTSSTTGDPITTVYSQIDVYNVSLTVIDSNQCQQTILKPDLVQVTGISPIQIDVGNAQGCELPHQSVLTIENPDTDVSYQWSLSNGEVLFGDQVNVTLTEFGVYDAFVFAEHNISGCRDTFLANEMIIVGLDVDILVNNTSICLGGNLRVEDQSEIPGELLWDFGDGHFSDQKVAFHIYEAPGCYDVSLWKKIGTCETTVQFDTCIEILPLPDGDLEFDKRGSCLTPATFEAQVNSNDAIRYLFGADTILLNTIEPTFQYQFDKEGEYPVFALIRSEAGCWRTIEDTLIVGEIQMEIVGSPEGCVPYTTPQMDELISSPFQIVEWDWQVFVNPLLSSNESSPIFNIADTGRFDLQLAVMNDEGCRDTFLLENYVKGGVQPDVSFIADPVIGCVDSIVEFSFTGSGFAHDFLWTFGDGSESIIENPTHEYQDTGIFDVSLTAEHNGCINYLELTDLIHIGPPIAKFSFSVNCASNEVVFFDESIGADDYFWDFGAAVGNGSVNDPNPVIVYPQNGVFDVVLLVSNQLTGCYDEFEQKIDLRGLDFDFDVPTTESCAPLEFDLIGVGDDIVKWTWKAPGGRIADDTLQQTTIEYRRAGKFPWIRLIAESSAGCRDTVFFNDTITIHQPIADFEVSASLVCAGETFTLQSISESPIVPIVSWNWTVGDQYLIGNGQNASFLLDTSGVFGVSLFVEDAFGCTDEISKDSVVALFLPDPKFSGDTTGCPASTLVFTPHDLRPGIEFIWDFGDGQTSSDSIAYHSYDQSGVYDVCLTVSNGAGCDSTICYPKFVTIANPIASFVADTTYVNCPPLLVQFENQSIDASTFLWTFGDGSGASDLESPAHIYTEPGVYDVRLISSISETCKDTMLIEDLIRIEGPQGEFTMEADTTCAPLEVKFVGTSIDEYKYIWDFGDGQLDSSEIRTMIDSTVYQYFKAGSYLPKLYLVDSEFCLRSFSAEDSIHVLEASVATVLGDTTICAGGTAIITAVADHLTEEENFGWINDPDLSCTDCFVAEVSPTGSSYYYFETIQENGCLYVDSVLVEVKELPELDLIVDTTQIYCTGDVVQVEAVADSFIIRFDWQENGMSLNCDTCPIVNLTLIDTTMISLEVMDTLGCTSQKEILIGVFKQQDSFVGPDRIICEGDWVELAADNVSSVTWSPADFVDCDTCQYTLGFPPESQIIYVDAIHPSGCPVRDTVSITVRTPEDIDAGIQNWLCVGESILLEGTGFGQASWSPSQFLDSPNEWITNASPVTTSYFVLTAEEGDCVLSDSVRIEVKRKASVSATGDTICYPGIAQIAAFGDIDDVQILGENPDLNMESDTLFLFAIRPQQDATFQIVGSLASCEQDTAEAFIKVNPEVNFELERDFLFYPNEPLEMKLEVSGMPNYTYQWTPEVLFDCPTCPNPNLTTPERVTVYVNVEDPSTGCYKMDSVEVRTLAACRPDDFIFVPNVFSPNQDGSNDRFQIQSAVHRKIDRIRLFNRWGNLVWSTTDIRDSWDGMYQGSPAPAGVYVYTIEGPCEIDDLTFRLKGDVTLIR